MRIVAPIISKITMMSSHGSRKELNDSSSLILSLSLKNCRDENQTRWCTSDCDERTDEWWSLCSSPMEVSGAWHYKIPKVETISCFHKKWRWYSLQVDNGLKTAHGGPTYVGFLNLDAWWLEFSKYHSRSGYVHESRSRISFFDRWCVKTLLFSRCSVCSVGCPWWILKVAAYFFSMGVREVVFFMNDLFLPLYLALNTPLPPSKVSCMNALSRECNGVVASSCGNDFLGKKIGSVIGCWAYCKKTSMESIASSQTLSKTCIILPLKISWKRVYLSQNLVIIYF